MTKEYLYTGPQPYSSKVVDYIHHTTEGGTMFVLEEFQNKVPQRGKKIYDCGCGLGRRGLSAFYSLLKSEGILTIFTTKTKGEPLENTKSMRDGSPLIKISRKEFAEVFKSEMGKVLPIRYYSVDLLKSILENPFSELMREIFVEEWAAASSEVSPSFEIIDFVVYRGENVNNFNEDYERAQKLLGIQCPIQPRDFIKTGFDERTAKLLRSFAAWIESRINQHDWKEGFLTDIMILAKKAK